MQAIENMEQFFSLIREPEATVMVFTADWCPDCQHLYMYMDGVVSEYQDKFRFYQVDKDEYSGLSETLDVTGIPSFIVYQEGRVVSRFVSRLRKERQEVTSFLDDSIRKLHL